MFAWEQGAPVFRLCASGTSPLPTIPQASGHSSCPQASLLGRLLVSSPPPPRLGQPCWGGLPQTWGPDWEWGCPAWVRGSPAHPTSVDSNCDPGKVIQPSGASVSPSVEYRKGYFAVFTVLGPLSTEETSSAVPTPGTAAAPSWRGVRTDRGSQSQASAGPWLRGVPGSECHSEPWCGPLPAATRGRQGPRRKSQVWSRVWGTARAAGAGR